MVSASIFSLLSCGLPRDASEKVSPAHESAAPIEDTDGCGCTTKTQTENVSEYHWVDSGGTTATAGAALVYFDWEGLVWNLSAETGQAIDYEPVTIYYSEADCDGDRYIAGIPPRVPFWPHADDSYYLRRDDQQSAPLVLPSHSTWDPAYPYPGCNGEDSEVWAFKLDEAYRRPELEPPVTGLSGPLRVEQ